MHRELKKHGLRERKMKPGEGPVFSFHSTKKDKIASTVFNKSNKYQYDYEIDSDRFFMDKVASNIIDLRRKGVLKPADAIWDFGCGVGDYLRTLQMKVIENGEKPFDMVGFDQSLRHAGWLNSVYRDKFDHQPIFLEGELNDLQKLPKNQVKYGNANFVLEYTPDMDAAIGKLHDFMANGGTMIFRFHHQGSQTLSSLESEKKLFETRLSRATPNESKDIKQAIALHERVLKNAFDSKSKLVEFLERNGFEVEEVEKTTTRPAGAEREWPDHFFVKTKVVK